MSNRKVRTERKVNNYGGLSDIGHVYKRTDMYAGSTNKKKHTELIYNNGKLIDREIKLPEAVKRAFLEIISNAGDNADASRNAKIDPGKIEITATEKIIKIKNYGLAIPIEKITLEEKGSEINVRAFEEGDEQHTWLPAYIFGFLRSSNNYDDENIKRTGAGKNGIGAKLVNILSKKFTVTVEDADNKRRFIGIWKDNMFMNNEEMKPQVEIQEDENIAKGSIEIEWELDFERFKMKKYEVEDLALFCRYAIDYSFACKVVVIFNDTEFDYRDIHKFATLFFEQSVIDTSITKYSWKNIPKDLEKNKDIILTKKIIEAKKANHIPELEVLILDTPDEGKIISYVNGLITVEGGVHVDCVQDPLTKHVAQLINGNKKRDKDKTSSECGIITSGRIKPHISLIVNARLIDTEYDSQSKTKLTSPQPTFFIEENKLKIINEWSIIQRLYKELEIMAFRNASKTDGKKAKHIKEEKGFNANKAGTRESLKCALYIVEGNSAAGYPRRRISLLENGKDYNGLAILKGKPLNITKAKAEKYTNNKVFAYIKQMIGLKEGIDYNSKANLDTLRYGFLIINVDADDDGYHILAHFLNFLREKFPGILKQNMVGYLRTPVIKLRKKDTIVKRFFMAKDFDDWKKTNDIKGYEIRYYKGLGSSEAEDVGDDLNFAPTIFCIYDDKSNENFDLAFHTDNADKRKEWIAKWRDITQIEDVSPVNLSDIIKGKNPLEGAQNISQFLNRELVNYSVTSLFRAIPSEYDHLKMSQRKALYASLNYFNYNPKDKSKRIKVGRLVYKSADMTQYHHGETSLIGTFIKMAQDFVGSNNMNYFYQGGGFGTREDGGKEAADARYSETHLSWWIPLVYYKESIELVPKHIIEGEECEPYWLPGVIPMPIVNGTNGIATGYSTSSPAHHPIEVIEWYENKCRGKESNPLIPWYNKFEGKKEIKVRDNSYNPAEEAVFKNEAMEALEKTSDEIEEEEKNKLDDDNIALLKHVENSKISLHTYGKFQIVEAREDDIYVIKVTELPVKVWSDQYKNWLNSIVTERNKDKCILDFDNYSSPDKVDFTIRWNKNYPVKPDIKSLKLVRSFGLSNITFIDHKGFPTQFEKIQDVMEKYYQHMIEHYKELRNYRISNEDNNVKDIGYMMKFIGHVMKEEIIIKKIKEEDVMEKMKVLGIPLKYYEKSKTRDFSNESLEKYNKQLEDANIRLEKAKSTTAEEIWLNKLSILKKELLKRKKGKFFNFAK